MPAMKKFLPFLPWIALLVAPVSGLGSVGGPEPLPVRAEVKTDRVSVWVGGALFTEYKFAEDQKYPYFFPVNGPRSGASVTTESSEPYPHHHSLFFGCDRVNGGNYWQEANERGRIVSRNIQLLDAGPGRAQWQNTCLWQRPGAPSPFQDERIITITAPSPDLRFIDFEITLTALIDVQIEKNNHSLFAARMVPELSVLQGGTLRNAEGQAGEKETFGVPSAWCDYWGKREGQAEGLAIFPHPGNPWHPPRWFTRDYGFFSPTPMFWLDNDLFQMKKDQTLHLRYRVVVHAGDTQAAGIPGLYDFWIQQP